MRVAFWRWTLLAFFTPAPSGRRHLEPGSKTPRRIAKAWKERQAREPPPGVRKGRARRRHRSRGEPEDDDVTGPGSSGARTDAEALLKTPAEEIERVSTCPTISQWRHRRRRRGTVRDALRQLPRPERRRHRGRSKPQGDPQAQTSTGVIEELIFADTRRHAELRQEPYVHSKRARSTADLRHGQDRADRRRSPLTDVSQASRTGRESPRAKAPVAGQVPSRVVGRAASRAGSPPNLDSYVLLTLS